MKLSYIMAFLCICFISLTLFIAAIDHANQVDTIDMLQTEIVRMKTDSVHLSRSYLHQMEWHEQRTEKEQREFINNDKKRRVK